VHLTCSILRGALNGRDHFSSQRMTVCNAIIILPFLNFTHHSIYAVFLRSVQTTESTPLIAAMFTISALLNTKNEGSIFTFVFGIET
jgi:hypothetical protein